MPNTRRWWAALSLLSLIVPPPAWADWPVSGYPLCRVPQSLGVPISRSTVYCGPAGPCGAVLELIWQDGRLNFSSIYSAVVIDVVVPSDPPAYVPANVYLERPGMQVPGAVVSVTPMLCLLQGGCATRVVVWTDDADGQAQVRARRDGDGIAWTTGGVVVASSAANGAQRYPGAVHDGAGGVIVAWQEATASHSWVFAQRLDGNGNRLWGEQGLFVGTDTTTQGRPALAADGAGGAYLLRTDRRGGEPTLALFRLGSDGQLAAGWPASGLVLGIQPGAEREPVLRVDASGAAWVMWPHSEMYSEVTMATRTRVTRVLPDGSVAPGFVVSGTDLTTTFVGHVLVDDAVCTGDRLLVVYESQPLAPGPTTGVDLHAVKFAGDGTRPPGWPAAGVVLCAAGGTQRQARMFAQGEGLFAAWTDDRAAEPDIYALRLDGNGARPAPWPQDGLLVCGAQGAQEDPVVGPNNTGGGYVVWRDGRDALTNQWDLYANTVTADATLAAEPRLPVALSLSTAHPNPARASATVSLALPATGPVDLSVLDVAGRLVHRESFTLPAGIRDLRWDLTSDAGGTVPPGLYLMRVRAGGTERTARVLVAR